jgi:hypothetical protein
LGLSLTTIHGHDVITTPITWNREISRIFNAHCVSCHHEGGMTFPLTTHVWAWAQAVRIKEEVLARRMPPWGGVKGFGEFRNDQALMVEQIEMIVDWVEGGVPEGNERDAPSPPNFGGLVVSEPPTDSSVVTGEFVVSQPFVLDGIWPKAVADGESMKIIAEFPDGTVQPLLWLYEYKEKFGHPFLFRTPIELPAGTMIRGIPANSSLRLLPLRAHE